MIQITSSIIYYSCNPKSIKISWGIKINILFLESCRTKFKLLRKIADIKNVSFKVRNIKSHSPMKNRANASPKKRAIGESFTSAVQTSNLSPQKRKFQFKVKNKINSSKKVSITKDPMVRCPKKRRKYAKGVSNLHEQSQIDMISSQLFSFENFGDVSSPRSPHSRKCNMDLSKFISDVELEQMRDKIANNIKDSSY